MPDATRRIGLSLGADICWPLCYEAIVEGLDLAIPHAGTTTRVAVERVPIRPFDLRESCPYDVVLDRVTHWYHHGREWLKKVVLMDGVYVFNNPWAIQSMEKQTSYCAMMRLGLPIPDTWLIPPKEYEPSADLQSTLDRYAKIFDLGTVGEALGYPMFMKPYDGGAWVGVTKLDDEGALRAAYESSGTRLMHVQKAVDPHDLFVRCVGVGPQTRMVKYDPGAPLHERYEIAFDFLTADEASLLEDITLTINGYFGWDFNSCESLRQGGTFYPIDFANACPDSQVTSLHYHFPWLIKSMIRWSVYNAVTQRRMRQCLDWEPYHAIADDPDRTPREKLSAYADITRERMEADRFEEFCDQHLGHLDEVAYEFFGTDRALEAVRAKVAALFPEHEIEQFTQHFWGLLQFWRQTEADRMASGTAANATTPAAEDAASPPPTTIETTGTKGAKGATGAKGSKSATPKRAGQSG